MVEASRISVTRQLRDWLEPRMDTADKVDLMEELPHAVEELRRDDEFVEQFLAQELLPHMKFIARHIMAVKRRRDGLHRERIIEAGTIIQTESSFEREASKRELGFYEGVWVHSQGQYIRFTRMTKPLLAAAIEESTPRQRTERIDRRFKLMVKAALPDENSTVEEVFSSEYLDRLWIEAEASIDAEMDKEEAQYD